LGRERQKVKNSLPKQARTIVGKGQKEPVSLSVEIVKLYSTKLKT